jgi:ubiquinone biosynthesis protein
MSLISIESEAGSGPTAGRDRTVRIGPAYLAGRLAAWGGVTAAHAARTGLEAAADRIRRPRRRHTAARGLARLLIGLGPTFVKGGQLLSTRPDLLPPAWCTALGRLHDRVGPMPRAVAEQAVRRGYAGDPPFAEFDWSGLASGSIAGVYRARLHDGRDVAVKVRRPGIARRMSADFRLLRAGATVGEQLPGLRRVPMSRMVDQLAGAVLRQLDFVQEAQALDLLRRNLDGLVRVPRPVPAASGEGVLVMEYVEGLGRFTKGEFTKEQRRQIVRQVLHGVYRMLFVDGLVHCDMHPGNLYLTGTGEVVLLDAGFVVRLDPAVKRLFAEFFLNLSTGRGEAGADVVLRSAEHVNPGADLAAFRAGVIDLVRASHRRTAGQFRLAPFAARLFDLQRRYGVAAAPEFVFPLLSLLVLEGMINEFDVDVDFQAEAIPTLLAVLRS